MENAHKLAHLGYEGLVYTMEFSDTIPAVEANKLGVLTVEDVVRVVLRTQHRVVSEEYYLVDHARRVWKATARAKDWFRVV